MIRSRPAILALATRPPASTQQEPATPDPGTDEPSDTPDGSQPAGGNGEVIVSDYTSAEDYTDEAMKTIQSLGKTVENEQLVVVGGNSDSTAYTVIFYDDGVRSNHAEYKFYIKSQEELFKASTEYVDETMEVNSDGLWVKYDYGQDQDSTWEDDYATYKAVPMMKVIE